MDDLVRDEYCSDDKPSDHIYMAPEIFDVGNLGALINGEGSGGYDNDTCTEGNGSDGGPNPFCVQNPG